MEVYWLVIRTANWEVQGSDPGQGRNLDWDLYSTYAPSQLSYKRYWSTKAEDKMARVRTGHRPFCAKAKKMKSLTLHTHGCYRASLRDWFRLLIQVHSHDFRATRALPIPSRAILTLPSWEKSLPSMSLQSMDSKATIDTPISWFLDLDILPMGPSIYDVHTNFDPLPMSTWAWPPPLVDVHMPSERPLFSKIFRILGIRPTNILYFICQNFWWPF